MAAVAQSRVYNGASNAPINISDMEDSWTKSILVYSQVPIKRVYSIIILRLFWHPTRTFSTLLDQKIFNPTLLLGTFFLEFHPTCLFGPTHFPSYLISKFSTLLVYLALLFLIFH